MFNRFVYRHFEPDLSVRIVAERLLDKIMDEAPYSATVIGLLEYREDGRFQASIEIYSRHRMFRASTAKDEPDLALEKAASKILRQLDRWKSKRGTKLKPIPSGQRDTGYQSGLLNF